MSASLRREIESWRDVLGVVLAMVACFAIAGGIIGVFAGSISLAFKVVAGFCG